MRGQGYRRAKLARAKARATKVVARWGSNPTPREVGIAAGVHCCACSCWLCRPGAPPSHARKAVGGEDFEF